MDNDQDVIAGCLATLKAIRAHASPTLTIRHLEILFHIYLSSGISQQDLAKKLTQLSESTIKQYIKDLGSVNWKDNYKDAASNVGHNLIVRVIDEHDKNIEYLYLNEHGHEVIRNVVQKMQDVSNHGELGSTLHLSTKGIH